MAEPDDIPLEDLRDTDALVELLYDELRKSAKTILTRERPGQTIQATALVHEAYARLVKTEGTVQWRDAQHFYYAAARAMRRIAIDRARAKQAQKRGGTSRRERYDVHWMEAETFDDHECVLAIDEAIEALAAQDSRRAEIVRLRYWTGMTQKEVAVLLDVSLATIEREWVIAKARLKQLMDAE